ncbi:hypothetical protein [Roseisolibacter sp. H3M3-2]|uniref:hypothetical protein n=1 Tax=Roseisolibacter sp. H3M3-2 TaxID=3031323 RepID=UPI0023D9C04B|nr:hypothetical protein [Roseisolibacter sp. H3M3-2]MDF1504563.1 hypothetical protein [Roseisolibacter sp. H3M3-2]
MRRRPARDLLAALAALAVGAEGAAAQAVAAPGGATVSLRLRPRAGDTLHLRFEQTVAGAAAAARAGAAAKPVPRLLSSMLVLSRSVVERSDAAGSVVVSHTDSVELRMPGAPAEALARARKGMQGKATRMQVAPDGAMRWLSQRGRGADTAAAGTALGLPGALPAMPVATGATWVRTMPLPWTDGAAARADGEAPRHEITFRLDSLARAGGVAFVSMRGRLLAADGAAVRVGGARGGGGSADGRLRLDLARGWITDSRVDFALDLVPPSAPEGGKAPPMRVVVSQKLVAR